MPNYRRVFLPGGTWFFTVNLLERKNNNLLVREIEVLRETVRALPKSEYRTNVRKMAGERGIYPKGTSGSDIFGSI